MRQKASDVCKRLGKPSSSDAKVLSRLFPSSVSRPPKRPLKAFDPASECVALVQQKKKKAFKSKPSNVEVIMVCDKSTIPRGKARKMLDDQGKVQKIEFRREMSNREVTNCVLRNFDHVHNLIGFTLLETDRGGKLHPSQNEKPDGEYIIVDGRRKSGPIYIYPILVSLACMLKLGDTEKTYTLADKASIVNIIGYWCQYKSHESFLFRERMQ